MFFCVCISLSKMNSPEASHQAPMPTYKKSLDDASDELYPLPLSLHCETSASAKESTTWWVQPHRHASRENEKGSKVIRVGEKHNRSTSRVRPDVVQEDVEEEQAGVLGLAAGAHHATQELHRPVALLVSACAVLLEGEEISWVHRHGAHMIHHVKLVARNCAVAEQPR